MRILVIFILMRLTDQEEEKNVQVYKFVTEGTLEEKIDYMIEVKKDLSDRILSAGDSWLTELSTDKPREMFSFREEY